jgi:hypothetical protein
MRYIILFFMFCLVSCKYGGTETGNPLDTSAPLEGSRVYKIAESACERVVECQSLSIENAYEALYTCLSQQLQKRDYAAKLGLPLEYQSSTLLDIIYAENEGDIIPNEPTKIHCINDIQQLSCSDTAIQQVLASPYDFVSDVLQPSCSEVF